MFAIKKKKNVAIDRKRAKTSVMYCQKFAIQTLKSYGLLITFHLNYTVNIVFFLYFFLLYMFPKRKKKTK